MKFGYLRAISFALAAAVAPLAIGAAEGQRSRPVFTIGDAKAETVVEMFFSPSCPDCYLAFRNAVAALVDGPVRQGKVLLVAYIMPRQDEDLRLGQILTCVPQEKLAPLTLRYMLDRSVGIQYDDSRLLGLIQRFGAGVSSLAECTDTKRETMLASINAMGIRLGVDDTPAWFIRKKKYQQVYFYWQLAPLISR